MPRWGDPGSRFEFDGMAWCVVANHPDTGLRWALNERQGPSDPTYGVLRVNLTGVEAGTGCMLSQGLINRIGKYVPVREFSRHGGTVTPLASVLGPTTPRDAEHDDQSLGLFDVAG